MVLGHSRWLWGRFVASQNLQSVLRCHIGAFEAMDGVPEEILYDRMKTAVIGEDDGVITYNAALVTLLNHYGASRAPAAPIARKGKIERPFRYVRQDFFLARTFRNLDDLNAQFDAWRTEVANPRVHATTRRIVDGAFAEERPSLKPLPAIAYNAVLTVERRASQGRHGLGRREFLLGAGHRTSAHAGDPAPCHGNQDLRGRQADRRPSGA